MTNNIANIQNDEYVTVQGQYAVVNQGTGYAIINIHTKEMVAQNISSFLDCVKTLEYILGKGDAPKQASIAPPSSPPQKTPDFGVRPDIQGLIEKYASTTIRVEKEVNWNRSKYKCYDAAGNYLGQVKGKLGDRYWKDSAGNRHY